MFVTFDYDFANQQFHTIVMFYDWRFISIKVK